MNDIEFTILYWIQDNIYCDFLTPFMKFFSSFGNLGIGWIIISFILICFKKTRRMGILALIAMLITLLINNYCIKIFFDRPRPFEQLGITPLLEDPGDSSFPSGHSANAFATATVFFLLDKKIGIPALILACLISFSRLYFMLHFPSDVIGGALIGIIVAVGTCHVADYIEKKRASTSGRL